MPRVTLLLVLLAFTWCGLAAWTYVDHRCSCDRVLGDRTPSRRDP